MSSASLVRSMSSAMGRAVSAGRAANQKKMAEEEADDAMFKKNMQLAQNQEPIKADTTAVNRRFDTLRARAKADVAQQTGEQQDALKRRFAQLGNLSSGAAMKQEQMLSQRGAELQQKAMEGIDVAQEQEQVALEEQAKQREFARGERVASQAFGAAESQLARKQQERQFNAAQSLQKSQFGEQMAMASKQFDLEKKIQEFNLEQAKKEANKGNLWQRFSGDVKSGDFGGALSTLIDPMGYTS